MPPNPPIILIVDDDPRFRELVAVVLRSERYIVRSAATGAEALTKAPGCALLLLDLNMAPMSGVEILDRLRERSATADLPVILITGIDSPAVHVYAHGQKVRAVLIKPVSTAILRETVARVLAAPAGHEGGATDAGAGK